MFWYKFIGDAEQFIVSDGRVYQFFQSQGNGTATFKTGLNMTRIRCSLYYAVTDASLNFGKTFFMQGIINFSQTC